MGEVVVILSVLATLCFLSGAQSFPVQISTNSGLVVGFLSSSGVSTFLGIPYAQPPVAALRWAPPVNVLPWNTALNATNFRTTCPQLASDTTPMLVDEDCLYLNVWVPASATTASRLPIMIFIPGGGFVHTKPPLEGGEFDGAALANSQNIIVVTMAYRVGVFGLFATQSLLSESPAGQVTTGNQLMQDQQLAVRWVQTNAHSFGGDPQQITLSGQSAGAISLCLHLLSPPIRGAFQRAMLLSGSCTTPFVLLSTALSRGVNIVNSCGCSSSADQLACMRTLPVSHLLSCSEGGGFSLNVDGYLVPQQPLELIQTPGSITVTQIILGGTADEGTIFFDGPGSVADYRTTITDIVGTTNSAIPTVEQLYPVSSFPYPALAAGAVFGDFLFTCSSDRFTQLLLSSHQHVTTYLYLFGRKPTYEWTSYFYRNSTLIPNVYQGAFHTSMLPFLWGNVHLTSSELSLSSIVMDLFGTFVRTGAPPAIWPAVNSAGAMIVINETVLALASDAALVFAHHCSFWDTVVLNYPYLRPSLSSGAIAGIVILIAFVIAMAVVAFIVIRRRFKSDTATAGGLDSNSYRSMYSQQDLTDAIRATNVAYE